MKLRFPCILGSIFALTVALVVSSSSAEPLPKHHTEDGFRNPYASHPPSRFFTYVRMRYFSTEKFAEYEGQGHRVPQMMVDLKPILKPEPEQAQATWIGHSTTLIQYRGINILTDPALSERASPFSFAGPHRTTSPALVVSQLPPVDYVVISHNHYDHLDLDTVRALGNKVAWVVPLKLGQWFRDQGIEPSRIHEMDWWASKKFVKRNKNVHFVATPAQHFSGRTFWDHNETLWSSWVIRVDDLDIWFGGDTGYNAVQFKTIGERYGPFELGLIPIGSYEPRWFMRPVHVDPAEAVQLHKDVRARFSIGIHWGTFPLSAEPIDEPMHKLASAVRTAGLSNKSFQTLAIGETRRVPILVEQRLSQR